MPRLMATQDDRTAYELGLNIFDKLGARSGSLMELNQRMTHGNKINKHEANDILDKQKELSSDLELLGQKIQEVSKNKGVSDTTLKLMANSAQSYACAYKATEIAVISKGRKAKKDCAMPFPGSFIMLNQQITVPKKVGLFMPSVGDENYLRPQEWMKNHMRNKVWCADSFSKHGWADDIMCDAITATMDMPGLDELIEERQSLLEIKQAKIEGKEAPKAKASPVDEVPAIHAAILMEEQAKSQAQILILMENQSQAQVQAVEHPKEFYKDMTKFIKDKLDDNEDISEELAERAAKARNKLAVLQKRSKLRKLKEQLAAKKALLEEMPN